jgi:hypothetical protein
MAALLLALVFTFSIRRRVAIAVDTDVNPLWPTMVGGASLSLWSTVAIAGRFVGFP